MPEVLHPAPAANLLGVTFLSSTSVWLALMSGVQASNQATLPLCTAIDVAVSTATPIVKRGTAPAFSVRVSNTGKVSTQVLNVRDGRRSDLQETYFELFVAEDGRVLDLPMAISIRVPSRLTTISTCGLGTTWTFGRLATRDSWVVWRQANTRHTSGSGGSPSCRPPPAVGPAKRVLPFLNERRHARAAIEAKGRMG